MNENAEPNNIGAYALGLGLVFICLFAGNLLGYVLASLWGWENLDYQKPGGTAFGALQGAIGAAMSLWASDAWLKGVKYADLWLRIVVWALSGLFFAVAVMAIISGKFDLLLTWKALATVANVAAIELVRRGMKDDF